MDPRANSVPDLITNYNFDDEIVLPNYEESPSLLNGLKPRDYTLDLNLMGSPSYSPGPGPGNFPVFSSGSSEADSQDDSDSDPVLRYLNQILLEENMEEKPSMFHDPLVLQAAEKSFADALGQNYTPPAHQRDHDAMSPDSLFGTSSEYSTNSSNTVGSSVDLMEYRSSGAQSYSSDSFPSPSPKTPHFSFNSSSSSGSGLNGQASTLAFNDMIPNIFRDSESILQFQKGMAEALKFLPTENKLFFDIDKYTLPPKSDEISSKPEVKIVKDENEGSVIVSKGGRKHLHRQESDIVDQRSRKQSAVYVEEVELSEMFDKVLLCKEEGGCLEELSRAEQQRVVSNGSGNGRARARNQESKSEAVDLRTLLISCAQSIASDDRRTATEQLKQIRQHSSSTGDAYQRLAKYFANGLEARMAGTGTEIYASLASKRISAAEKLKAFQLYLEACPFKKISIFFTIKMIMMKAENASTLHIVDFGICYGFQWPMLIQQLSSRPGGPPKLRITGIEHPQPGFKPAERVEEVGRRLARYCERFNVPFEYQAIALQHWETLKIEDLKLGEGEFLAVTSLFQFNHLLDETVVVHSPRDAVLRLIRTMNPDIFVNCAGNGAYNAPFFVTRFREALFHYSSLFDIFDTTLPRDDPERLNFEEEFYGREIINVIACEGPERVVRPEPYKQWHIRHIGAGLKPIPLPPDVMKKLRAKTKAGYHKDFVFDEDGCWMLQGWKGRIIYGCSCWTPA